MAIFSYTAIDPGDQHKTIEGKLEAENLREAKEILRSQGHIPTRLEQEEQNITVVQVLSQIPVLGEMLGPQVSLKDIAIMTEQLYVLLDAGIPLIEGLFLLEQQSENKALKDILKKIRSDVIAGDSFSSALSKFPKQFSRLYLNMIRSGEVSGELDGICSRLSALLEKIIALQATLVSAMIYPAVTILVVIGVIIIIMVVVVPQFENMFSQYGADLPLPTQILITCSDFTLSFWWAIAIAAGTLVFWFNVFRLGAGKPMVDQWMLTLPLVGDVFTKIYVSRFIRTLGTVLGAGVSLTEGIVTAAGTVDNYVLNVAFERSRESILQGGSLSKPLEKTGIFPVMVVKMIAIGEETGSMEKMLNKAADFLDVEVDRAVERMTTLIEPLMVVVLGGIILGIALALYIPLFEMGNVVTGGGH